MKSKNEWSETLDQIIEVPFSVVFVSPQQLDFGNLFLLNQV